MSGHFSPIVSALYAMLASDLPTIYDFSYSTRDNKLLFLRRNLISLTELVIMCDYLLGTLACYRCDCTTERIFTWRRKGKYPQR